MLGELWQKIKNKLEKEPEEALKKDLQVKLALDIGTEFVKAVIVEYNEKEERIIGVSRLRQEYGDMEGGAVANIEGVTRTAGKAVERAAKMAGVMPADVMIGLAGEFVKGIRRTVLQERKNPEKKLDWAELKKLALKAQKEAMDEAEKQLLAETGFSKIDVELVNTAIVEVKIDGYKVSNPLDFQGRNVEMTIFNTFAPLLHVGALQTIAESLGLNLIGTMAEPYAVACSTITDEIYEFGAVIIDIGGGTTDIAVVRNGGVEGTKMFSMGGRAFTKTIAAGMNLDLKKAEELKIAYSSGKLFAIEKEKIQKCLQADLQIWQDGVALFLEELAEGKPLPTKICLCGGGGALPDHLRILRDEQIYSGLPFAHLPEVVLLTAKDVVGPSDAENLLQGQQDVTPKSLAYQVIVNVEKAGLWERIFDKTLQFLNC